jgi:hypothetical protein
MVQSIVAGGIYFDEFRQLRGWPAFVFSIGLVSAIAGALGMGCASFFADQHAMISYSMLPGTLGTYCQLHRFDRFVES